MLTSAILLLLVKAQTPSIVFEESFDGSANGANWRRQTWAGRATIERDPQGRRQSGIKVSSDVGADAGWGVRIPIKPFSKYRFSGWIKTEGITVTTGQGAVFNLHDRTERTEPITGSKDWKEVGFEFESGGEDSIQINALIGYHGLARGSAWFDDLKLELLSTQSLDPKVTLDATQTREPINPYVYGQFIEHLGRCIYGGIWAEMLEDRKFYWPVGAKESPWQTVGGVTVSMDSVRTFSGEHSAKVDGVGGVSQGKLGVVRGGAYVGYLWLAAEPSVGPVDVALRWDYSTQAVETVRVESPSREFKRYAFRFKAGETTDLASLSIMGQKPGTFWVGAVSLMPADNVKGFRKDTLELLKQLNSPIYRWPGGNFVSAYDWRDGIGDRDRRPTRKNPAWQGIDSNDVGLHEFMEFCDLIKTEPLVVVNTGFGDAHSAAKEVEYVNGSANSEWGAKRAKNGRKEPWKVRWWAVGNEMYGDWQHGHMALNWYVMKHNEFVRYMRQADPSIKLIGVGAAGQWSEGMLTSCAEGLDLLSEHFYTQNRPAVTSHVAQMPNQVRRIADAHRDYRKRLPSLKGKDIRIALDEWNYWYGPYVYGELGTVYFMKDALGVAAGLHEIFRNSDLYFMANYAQTVNVIGAIKTTKTKAAFDTTGWVLQKYREVFGTIPIAMSGAPEPLNVSAALSADRKRLTIGIVNPMGEEQTLKLEALGTGRQGPGVRWELSGEPLAHNTPDAPSAVRWVESKEPELGNSVRVKPYSVTILVVPIS